MAIETLLMLLLYDMIIIMVVVSVVTVVVVGGGVSVGGKSVIPIASDGVNRLIVATAM